MAYIAMGLAYNYDRNKVSAFEYHRKRLFITAENERTSEKLYFERARDFAHAAMDEARFNRGNK